MAPGRDSLRSTIHRIQVGRHPLEKMVVVSVSRAMQVGLARLTGRPDIGASKQSGRNEQQAHATDGHRIARRPRGDFKSTRDNAHILEFTRA